MIIPADHETERLDIRRLRLVGRREQPHPPPPPPPHPPCLHRGAIAAVVGHRYPAEPMKPVLQPMAELGSVERIPEGCAVPRTRRISSLMGIWATRLKSRPAGKYCASVARGVDALASVMIRTTQIAMELARTPQRATIIERKLINCRLLFRHHLRALGRQRDVPRSCRWAHVGGALTGTTDRRSGDADLPPHQLYTGPRRTGVVPVAERAEHSPLVRVS